MTHPFFSAGFRPMFLGTALWACLSMGLWITYWTGLTGWEPPIPALDWHVHELLFGYSGAVLCGFLLTAIPNWTGRPAVKGLPLAGLWALWIAGRLVMTLNTGLPLSAVIAIDLSFPALFALIAAREIITSGNRRNLPVVGMVTLIWVANLLFDLALLRDAPTTLGLTLGISILILLISLIGGRIIPAFTRNWLKQHGATSLPVEFTIGDKLVLLSSGAALALWVADLNPILTGPLLIFVGLAHLWRQTRWQAHLTLREPLIFALHTSYAFVPLGFILTGATLLWQMPPMAALHAWTSGAIGTMTLIVMTRASLGHSGRPLRAGSLETLFLSAVTLASLTRILSALGLWPDPLLHLSATLWMLGFGLFALRFARIMVTPRPTP